MSYYGTDLELATSLRGVIGVDGKCNIENIGPVLSWERWNVESIQTWSDSTLPTYLYVYRRGQLVAGTYSGNFDTSDSKINLMPGELLSFRYENGSPGANVLITLSGRRKLRTR